MPSFIFILKQKEVNVILRQCTQQTDNNDEQFVINQWLKIATVYWFVYEFIFILLILAIRKITAQKVSGLFTK